jgi:hypothetical protein
MISTRERRWKRLEAAYGRLPYWLQVVLYPWTIPARWLAFFPVLTPAVCLVGAGFLAYLKLAYLYEQVTWSQVAMMVIAPLLLLPLTVCVAFAFVTCLFAPILAPLALVEWWRGEPLQSLSRGRPGKRPRSARLPDLLWDPDLDA